MTVRRAFRSGGRRRPKTLLRALVWAGLLAGAALLAPVADDLRSQTRTMRTDCRVVRVIDGDTVDVACPGAGAERARIVGYDSAELFSPMCAEEKAAAEAAKRHLAALLQQSGGIAYDTGGLEMAFLGRDRYARRLVDVRVGGQRLASRMVDDGHGRRYLGGLRGGWCG